MSAIHHLKLRTDDKGIPDVPELDGKPLMATKIGIFARGGTPTMAMIELPVQLDFEGHAEIATVEPPTGEAA